MAFNMIPLQNGHPYIVGSTVVKEYKSVKISLASPSFDRPKVEKGKLCLTNQLIVFVSKSPNATFKTFSIRFYEIGMYEIHQPLLWVDSLEMKVVSASDPDAPPIQAMFWFNDGDLFTFHRDFKPYREWFRSHANTQGPDPFYTGCTNPSLFPVHDNDTFHPPLFETATCPSYPLHDSQPPPSYEEAMKAKYKSSV